MLSGMRPRTTSGDWLRVQAGLRVTLPTGGFSLVSTAMSDVTRILSQIEDGDPSAAEQLLPLVYDELRKLAAQKMAQEKPSRILQATALVHEAYIRLVDVRPGSTLEQPRPFLRGRGRSHAADSGGARTREAAAQAWRGLASSPPPRPGLGGG